MLRKKGLITLLFALGLTLGLFLGDVFRTPEPGLADPQQRGKLRTELNDLQGFAHQLETLFQGIAEYVSPAVVYISSEKTVKYRVPGLRFRDPFFERFFNDEQLRRFFGPREREQTQRALGSGFIFDKEGYILTNNHVVAGADKVEVKLADNQTFRAEVVGADEDTDLAVIKIQGKVPELPVVELGDSDSVRVGQWVIAVGNPFGFEHTVSTGIVSAKGRALRMARYESLIQTDAAINPGNSGGPLVNLKGEVIGINTAIASTTGGNLGIGFAIPINMAKSVLPELKRGEKVVRGYLGIYGQNLTPELAGQFGYKGKGGALVQEVQEGTPAAKARPVDSGVGPGLKPGDIITEWNGQKIKSFDDLRLRVAGSTPGSTVGLKVWREGKELSFKVVVEKLGMEVAEGGWLGIRVQALTEEMARRLGRSGLKGVLVADVAEDSPARGAISPGDVILSVSRQKVESVGDYRRLISQTSPEKGVLLRFYNGQRGYAQYVFLRRR